MDKNTIIAFILILGILIGFNFFNTPSAEELEQRKKKETIELAQKAEEQEKLNELIAQRKAKEKKEIEASKSVDNFFTTTQSSKTNSENNSDFFTSTEEEIVLNDTVVATKENIEKYISLENEHIKTIFSTKGGRLISAELKEYKRFDKDSLFLFKEQDSRFYLELINRKSNRLSTEELIFTPTVNSADNSVTMRYKYSDSQFIDFIYKLTPNDYMLNFDIKLTGMNDILNSESLEKFHLFWEEELRQQEKSRSFENRYTRIHYKYAGQGVEKMSESKSDQKEITEPVKWFAFKDQFFASILIAEKPFSNTMLSSFPLEKNDYLKKYKAEVWAPTTISDAEDVISANFKYYLGIVNYTHLKAYDKNIENKEDKLSLGELVPLGWDWLSWINKYFVIVIFNIFLSMGWNMGIIILILTLIVKVIVSPLTFKSFKSSAKMRALRPQVKEIEQKYPNQDQAMEKQKATMALYRKVGVSPMSGCLPMLLQSPILIALFWFFPSAIELRQQSFLWADDLSSYDAIFEWTTNIPLISGFLGNHISLFCLLMTVTNIVYAKFNMEAQGGGQQMAGMKFMPYMMSIVMLFVFNSYPAGLSYYYFISTLITIMLTLAFRKMVDEKTILAQLEANKSKPKKKSSFMARLEQAQKQQEQIARERAKKRK